MKHPGLINSIKEHSIFEWSKKNINIINKILKKYPSERKQSAVLPLLDIAQRQNRGWLSKSAIEKVAFTLSMPIIRVTEVATFYSMFNLRPIGKNFIQICRTTPCWLRGSKKLLEVAKNETGCALGETSKDNLFTLVEVECLGACCNAPMVQINDNFYEDLDEKIFSNILQKLKKNIKVNPGSQIGRNASEPFEGK
ncbi:MAG: NADH-quinone oxidoreductase chain 2 [Alphaproteobacteria bacterium MarineAlpha5_Bin9]|nr:MAG: NADH-quinone oxidoreductase chain 2 [Alphaproteobacteria bacterium MarineAlpha5_Bin9]|tara:strand:- start:1607 stop:2194 length:588 start_codon:yes stop_codon:yes gene_type:complete